MERLSPDEEGGVVIRTLFGEVSEHYFPLMTRAAMIEDEGWRAAAGVEGGPFCCTPAERLMPF